MRMKVQPKNKKFIKKKLIIKQIPSIAKNPKQWFVRYNLILILFPKAFQ